MTYSPEDHVSSPAKRHKYYLIHFSRHHAAPLAMKEVLYRARGELQILHAATNQLSFEFEERDRRLNELQTALREGFSAGQQLTFLDLRVRTANWPFAESEYRQVVKEMDEEGRVAIERRQSKRKGLADGDLITFH